jgi:hypothetical protein
VDHSIDAMNEQDYHSTRLPVTGLCSGAGSTEPGPSANSRPKGKAVIRSLEASRRKESSFKIAFLLLAATFPSYHDLCARTSWSDRTSSKVRTRCIMLTLAADWRSAQPTATSCRRIAAVVTKSGSSMHGRREAASRAHNPSCSRIVSRCHD